MTISKHHKMIFIYIVAEIMIMTGEMTLAGSMEYHQLQLDKHCRVCAQQLQKYRLKYECGKCTEELAQFGVNTALDSKVVHPSHLCHLCYVTAKNILNGKTKYTTTVPFDWTSHTQTACKVCTRVLTR